MKKFLLVLLGCLTMAGCGEAKVTDPNDPRFDPMKFDFNDYKTHEELSNVLRILFQVGDSREEVEKILVEAGGG